MGGVTKASSRWLTTVSIESEAIARRGQILLEKKEEKGKSTGKELLTPVGTQTEKRRGGQHPAPTP